MNVFLKIRKLLVFLFLIGLVSTTSFFGYRKFKAHFPPEAVGNCIIFDLYQNNNLFKVGLVGGKIVKNDFIHGISTIEIPFLINFENISEEISFESLRKNGYIRVNCNAI